MIQKVFQLQNISFVQVPIKLLLDPNISPEALRMWGYFYSRPPGWVYNRKEALKFMGSAYRLDGAIKQLKNLGYLKIEQKREAGRITGYAYFISPYQTFLEPDHDNHEVEAPPDPDYHDHDIQDHVIQDAYIDRSYLDQKETISIPPNPQGESTGEKEAALSSEKKKKVSKAKAITPVCYEGEKLYPDKNGRLKIGRRVFYLPKHLPQEFLEWAMLYPADRFNQPASRSWDAKFKAGVINQEEARAIIENTKDRLENDNDWIRGYYTNASTFINQERWLQPIAKPKAKSVPAGTADQAALIDSVSLFPGGVSPIAPIEYQAQSQELTEEQAYILKLKEKAAGGDLVAAIELKEIEDLNNE